MKNIPIQLEQLYQKAGRSTAFCVKVNAKSGITYGFTTLDDVIRFDDGSGLLTYEPTSSLTPQNIQTSCDFDPDNTELHGWFDNSIKNLVAAGEFNSAEITIYRVAYLNPTAGAEVVAYGIVGEVEYSAAHSGVRKVEFKGLDELLNSAQTVLYSKTCRNEFGDELCGKPFVWNTGTVDEVTEPRTTFKVTGISQPDDHFNLGVLEFLSGDNATATLEIESWLSDGWVKLAFPAKQNIVAGISVRLRQDCDKTFASCQAYNNVPNMNAEHLTPVEDTSLMVPGAYIRSNNAI